MTITETRTPFCGSSNAYSISIKAALDLGNGVFKNNMQDELRAHRWVVLSKIPMTWYKHAAYRKSKCQPFPLSQYYD